MCIESCPINSKILRGLLGSMVNFLLQRQVLKLETFYNKENTQKAEGYISGRSL